MGPQQDASQLANAASQAGTNPVQDFNAALSISNLIGSIAPTRGFSVSLSQSFQEWLPFQQQIEGFYGGAPSRATSPAQIVVMLAWAAWKTQHQFYEQVEFKNAPLGLDVYGRWPLLVKYWSLYLYFSTTIFPQYEKGFRTFTSYQASGIPASLDSTQLAQVQALAGALVPPNADWVQSWEALVKTYLNACLAYVFGSSAPQIQTSTGPGPISNLGNYVQATAPTPGAGLTGNGLLVPVAAAGALMTT